MRSFIRSFCLFDTYFSQRIIFFIGLLVSIGFTPNLFLTLFYVCSASNIPRQGLRGQSSEAGSRAAHQRFPCYRLQVPRRRRTEGTQRRQRQ